MLWIEQAQSTSMQQRRNFKPEVGLYCIVLYCIPLLYNLIERNIYYIQISFIVELKPITKDLELFLYHAIKYFCKHSVFIAFCFAKSC